MFQVMKISAWGFIFIHCFCQFQIEKNISKFHYISVFKFIDLFLFHFYTSDFKIMLYKLPFMVYHLLGHL